MSGETTIILIFLGTSHNIVPVPSATAHTISRIKQPLGRPIKTMPILK